MYLISSYQLFIIAIVCVISIQAHDDNKQLDTSSTRSLELLPPDEIDGNGIVEGQYKLLSTMLEMKKRNLYAGCMFNIKATSNVKVSSIAFNTYTTTPLDIVLYIREGGYEEAEYDLDEWMQVVNITVTGQGTGNLTYIPKGSFEPILLEKRQILAIYLHTPNGPNLITSRGKKEGGKVDIGEDSTKNRAPMWDGHALILYEGVGKRRPIDRGKVFSSRVFNGAIGYNTVRKQPAPISGASLSGLRVANETFTPNYAVTIKNSNENVFAMQFDGLPEVLAQPYTLLSAELRLFVLEKSYFGGNIYVINNESRNRILAGKFGRIYSGNYYEINIAAALERANISSPLIIAVIYDKGDLYHPLDNNNNTSRAPSLTIGFAYDEDSNQDLAELYGTVPPSTTQLAWENSIEPENPIGTYFNYDPNSKYGLSTWNNEEESSERDCTCNNHCTRRQQSPIDLCVTDGVCHEYHELRRTTGSYGLNNRTRARPIPHIMHNKLRLSYGERSECEINGTCERKNPIPPRADFAHGGGYKVKFGDLLHIDIKVKSEHRLCGKQYDAEMQLHYSYYGRHASSLLIEVKDGQQNDHFQELLDFFQAKFNEDETLCRSKQLRRRALFDKRRGVERVHRLFHTPFVQHSKIDATWDPLEAWSMYRSIYFWGYSGTTTEPPCKRIKWRITDVPFHISPRQYIQLKSLMFDHVDPQTCRKTSTHFQESNARPIQMRNNRTKTIYRCTRENYVSDMERVASGQEKGFDDPKDWTGVDMFPYVSEWPIIDNLSPLAPSLAPSISTEPTTTLQPSSQPSELPSSMPSNARS